MALTPLPPAPLISDSKTVFNEKASPFVQALGPMVNEINAVLLEIDGVGAGLQKVLRTPENISALPNAATRANKLLGFNAGGDTVVHTYSSVRTLLNVADGATANDTNANLRNRATHTGVQAISTVSGLQSALDSKVDDSQIKTNLASPDNSSVPSTLAVASAIADSMAGETPRGAWDASTNTPALASSVGTAGYWYEVSVAGTTDLNGETGWQVGDKAIFNGVIWTRIPANAVRSVDGRTGDIVTKVASVADMVASTSIKIGDIVEFVGYYGGWAATAKGPVGGNVCEIVAAGTGTADGGSFIDLVGIAGQAKGLFLDGIVTPERFGARGDQITDDTVACQRAIDFNGSLSLELKSKYRLTASLYVRRNGYSITGNGWYTGFTGNTDFGSSLIVESSNPLTTTIFRVSLSNFEIDRTFIATSGALLRITEAAYCTAERISLQNGFIGFHGQGLRACFINVMHIRSGAYFTALQPGSRFALFEDSPSGVSFAENTETLVSDLNCTTNSANAYVEYGIELKEADGIWFDNGHVRGAALANGFINGATSPQLLGVKFDNFWFDGLTDKCLLVAGTPAGYMGFLQFNDCSFTGGTTRAIETQFGAGLDWIEFNSCNVWSIDSQVPIRFDSGANIHISDLNLKALNASNAANSSAIVVGAAVNSITVNGGNLFNSPNIDNGISINDGVVNATINNFTFKGLAASAKPVNIANIYTVNYNSTGCSTDQAAGYVAGNMQRGRFGSVADDTAVSVPIGEILGGVLSVAITLNTTASGIIALETLDPSTISIIAGGPRLAVTTGVLTGTTGDDGDLTVSVTDDGTLYFENRTGVVRSIIWRFIDRDL